MIWDNSVPLFRPIKALYRRTSPSLSLRAFIWAGESSLAVIWSAPTASCWRFASRLVVSPVPPVRRSDVDFMPSARFQPASLRASARKNKGVRAVVVYHRQFKIAVERCGHYPLPIHQTNKPHAFRFGPDSDQKSRKVAVALSVTIRVSADSGRTKRGCPSLRTASPARPPACRAEVRPDFDWDKAVDQTG